ncbi:hypothetical protein C9374_007567 [Naegleria lovaniensis]|uniref:NHL repeat-containing protein n=1 Tax=Naegleria lovaniensis TaxID=51637 RepID=A0AA88KLH7_NAELO|nr:uncharacterized protein C9374_007567 [Naegleria lovaniensis]KAG2378929.1 hypothetical protein C9374_007567 [Naegleria lovaniensis]
MDKNLSRSGLKTPSTQQQHAHKMHLLARHLFHHLVLHLFLLLLLLILLFTHFSIWSKIHSSPQHVDSFQQVVQASKLTSFPKPLYNISTWVGGGSNFNFAINSYGDSTNRVDAMYSCLQYPKSLSLNSNHSILYVAATYDHMIRKISKHPSNPNMNLISTVAGVGVDGFSDDSFLAKNAKLSRPTHAIEHPVNSDVIISDSGNHFSGYDGDSGLALNAKFNNSMYLAITKNGSWLYVADTFNGRVRRVNIPEGTIETIAGNPTGQNGDCPVAIDCLLDQPQESASNRIRILSLTTSPMSLTSLQLGGGVLNFPTQIALHENQQALYILDHNAKQVKKVSPLGASSVLQLVYGSEYFEQPGGLAVNSDLGHVYVSDVSSNLVKLFSNGDPKIVAGKCQRTEFIGDNVNGTEVELVRPSALAFDSISGELYIADTDNHVIRKLQNNGIIVTLAGNTQPGNFNTTMVVMANSTRLDAVAYMYPSVDVQTGKVSSLYMSDSGQSVIMKWNLMDGTIVGVAGTKLISADSGDGGLAIHALVSPKSLLVVNSNFSTNASAQQQAMKNQVRHGMIHTELALENTIYKNTIGEVYFVNSYSNTIRKILTNGTIVRVAGLAQQNVILNAGDGGLALEATMSPQAITFDLEGNLLVSSRGMIRKIFIHNGTIVGVAGQNGNYGFSGDEGLALNAQFSSNIPSLSGMVTTVAGNGSSSFSSIGEYEPSNALTRYVGPLSIIGGDNNSLYLVENNAKRVRKLIQYCQEGWTGSDCSILQLKKLRAYFETSMAFTGLTISLMIKIEDEDFKYYAPETITYSVSLFKEPMIQKSDLVVSSNFSLKDSFQYKFESNGNYSAEVKVMFERNVLGSVKSLNKLQVVNYEELMSENSMKDIPVKEVASLALNPEMYSNASTMVNTLSVLTRVLTSSSVRNSSDLSETLTVVNALGAISSNREEFLPTTVMSSISSFLSNVSSEIVVISQGMTSDSSNGQLSTVESTAKNILTEDF